MSDYAQARTNMVECQIKPNKVTDPAVIRAFLAVKREDFVPASLRGAAYIDEDLPLGGGRYLMEPMVLARLVQEAAIDSTDHVLDIAGGTGYSAAILAQLCASVVALESDANLASAARAALTGLVNVRVVEGNAVAGQPATQPYDVILINGAIETVPEALLAQLADGGRLVAVQRRSGTVQGEAVLFEKLGGSVSHRILFDAAVPDLAEFRPAPSFAF